jgi:hypothetical protein
MPLYARFGRKIFHTKEKEEVVVDMTRENTFVNDPSLPTSPTSLPFTRTSTTVSRSPHKATRDRGTWKWSELFSIFSLSEYRPALNIEHYSERLGLFAIIALGEGVSIHDMVIRF